MTKYEKWTIRLSFSAIIISIISIIVTIVIVIKFNPILLELKHAGRVTVAEKFLFDDDEKKGYQIELHWLDGMSDLFSNRRHIIFFGRRFDTANIFTYQTAGGIKSKKQERSL